MFAACQRSVSVLMENAGSALLPFLIQIVVGLGIGAVILISYILGGCVALDSSAIAAYFSTLWTLA